VNLTHSSSKYAIADAELREIARGLPATYRDLPPSQQSTWSETRHEVHLRSDQTRVGVIWGEAKRTTDNASIRTVHMMFPDDAGTSLLTVSYGTDDGTNLEQAFVTSADQATGVALRGPGPPSWMYGAWGVGGLVFAIIISGLMAKKKQ
jgi:hypothetical protein